MLYILILHLINSTSNAQDNGSLSENDRNIYVKNTDQTIVIDGILNETIWSDEPSASDFWQYFPFDTAKALSKTEVWITFNERYIYVAAKLYDEIQGDYVTHSLKRDYPGDNTDGFTMILDPFQDKTNGFFFSVNPYGVQREGLISNGGASETNRISSFGASSAGNFDLTWDSRWFSAVFVDDGYWSLEMAIPFKTLRFQRESRLWGINFYRTDSKLNEKSIWARVPRQFEMYNLAFTGNLHFESILTKPGANVVLIPYTAASILKINQEGSLPKMSISAGVDSKISLTPSLNLDLTFNPDFSQVEVDVQQTNLDRFELFYPERRQFFLENADLFSSFGSQNARPFFSRRIGVAVDTATGQNVQNRITGGVRLSGRLNENWRLGVLNIQTQSDHNTNVTGSNYATIAIQRKVFTRSNISAIFVNKQNKEGKLVDPADSSAGNYNRLIGIEYNLASFDGKWTGKSYYHQTFSENSKGNAFSHLTTVNYSTLKFDVSWTHQIIGDGFNAMVGFVPRTDFTRINPVISFNIYRNTKWINRYRFSLSNNTIWNDKWGVTDNNLSASMSIDFQNTAMFTFSILSNYIKLFFPFNPTGNTNELFMPGEHFTQNGFMTMLSTNMRKPFFAQTAIINGIFYNGNLRQLSGNINYRYKQYATLALSYNINQINLKNGYSDATLFLFGLRGDLTLTTNLFWITFIQYNSQLKNLNINSKLQWRFRPVSDLYIVYTDNYFPEHFRNKNRAIVFK
ncbi:MAG: DUF5916 domain-containing protein, partial [Bacteroidales bacterium]